MNDHDLRDLLKQMPDVPASEGFTDRTLARLREPRAPARTWHRFAVVAAACLLVAAVAVPTWMHLAEKARQEQARAELAALKKAHDRLSAELAMLRQSRHEPRILYLGGTDSVDYVIDLHKLAQHSTDPGSRAVRFRKANL